MKALKRGLTEYLKQATHSDEISQGVLSRPVVRQALYHVAMLHLVQPRLARRPEEESNWHRSEQVAGA